jgi:hypothetical protein
MDSKVRKTHLHRQRTEPKGSASPDFSAHLECVCQGQEFVIGGYTPSPKNFDALIFGYYEGDQLIYVARTRNGLTPRSREELFRQI